jgi:hypothetical protein
MIAARAALILAALVTAALAASCGDSSPSPSAPTQPQAPTQPVVPSASLRTPLAGQPGSQLSLTGCDSAARAAAAAMGLATMSCPTFSGGVENTGTGCAANVHGTTVTLNGLTQVGSAPWTYASIVRPGEVITYAGGPITIHTTGGWNYSTTFLWDNVPCQ